MNLDLRSQSLVDGLSVEASAGTGKTYSITALVTRELVADPTLSIGEVLITTFTRNAAAQLRERMRRMLVAAEGALRGPAEPTDEFLASLRDLGDPADGAARIRRALATFDAANIMTIHQFCSIVLKAASQPVGAGGDDVPVSRLVAQAVNDELVGLMGSPAEPGSATAYLQDHLDPVGAAGVVTACLAHQRATPLLVTGASDAGGSLRGKVERELRGFVEAAAGRVRATLRTEPSYDELVRRANEILGGGEHESVRAALAARFRFVLVDEAQDTDGAQWEILGAIFRGGPVHGSGGLISIGDPKQAIYGFRGADVNAYLRHVGAVDPSRRRTLTTNYRSDEGVVVALNALLDGARFGGVTDGPQIEYEQVQARDAAEPVRAEHPVIPVSIVDCGDTDAQTGLTAPAVSRVLQLLSGAVTIPDGGEHRAVRPEDVTVLARTGWVARSIQRELLRRGVPAVSNSTESVAKGETYDALRRLARALARPSHDGLARILAVGPLFGWSMLDPVLRDDGHLALIQELLERWRRVLETDGVTSLAAEVLAAEVPGTTGRVAAAFLGSPDGLRRLTDFAHVVEYVHGATRGRGIQPFELLRHLDELASVDETSEAAARRVESDEAAVQTMTVHAAKGLEFAVVVVADLWKRWVKNSDGRGATVVESDGSFGVEAGARVIDLGLAIGGTFPGANEVPASELVASVDGLRKSTTFDEKSRLFYVAVTRAKHHLSVLVPRALNGGRDPEGKKELPVSVRDDHGRGCLELGRIAQLEGRAVVETVPALAPPSSQPVRPVAPDLLVAPSRRVIEIVHPRTSFTGVTKPLSGRGAPAHVDELPRVDDERVGERLPASSADEVPALDMPLWPLPAGRHVGNAIHLVLEHASPSEDGLEAGIRRAVDRFAPPGLRTHHGESLVRGLVMAMETPIGEAWEDARLCDLGSDRRVAEMRFNAGLATGRVTLPQVGAFLASRLDAGDPLVGYAHDLEGVVGAGDLRGVLNGSIDALLRLTVRGEERFVVADYKSNRLAQPDHLEPLARYAPAQLVREMASHHYPLQALLYGVATFRHLRWRTGDAVAADRMVGGFAYFFVRGMLGAETPVDGDGRYGVASWSSDRYPGFWRELSDLLGGVDA
jgi:exodeoxyribonuclease V beta subunit